MKGSSGGKFTCQKIFINYIFLSWHVFLKLFWYLNPCIKCPFDGEATTDTTRKICPIQMTCTTIPYVHSIGCRIGSGCKKWYLIFNFCHVLVWWHIQVLWWWLKLQLSITTSTNMADLFQLWKLQGSLKHDYILFIELIVPSVATFDYL